MAELVGMELDPWQRMVIEGSFGLKDGEWQGRPLQKWASKEVGVNVPRQNGKGGILEVVELTALFTWLPEIRKFAPSPPLVIHSAHEFITSQKHFDRVWALVEDTPELLSRVVRRRPIRTHGHEGFKTVDGCQVEFRSRTKAAGRGFSSDFLVFDEAMFLPEAAMGALFPTLRARPNPQVWYTGSAVDQDIHTEGLVWTRVRDRALREEPELTYLEWSLDYADPNEVPEEAYHDEDSYFQSNPAYGIRIFKEHFANEIRALDRRTVAVELFGVGDYPDPTGSEDRPVSPEQWEACISRESELQDPVWLAFDTSPERRTCIAAAGRNQFGEWHVEVFDKRPGTKWLPDRLEELKVSHGVEKIVCDGLGPSASLLSTLEQLEIEVEKLDAGDVAAACGRFVDLVTEGSVKHLGSLDLMNAIRGAKTRPLGERWAWSRKNSTVDISPLVAATLALYAALGSPVDDGEVRFW